LAVVLDKGLRTSQNRNKRSNRNQNELRERKTTSAYLKVVIDMSEVRMMRIIMIASSVTCLLLSVLLCGCSNKNEDLDLSAYQYRDTKELVRFVYDASMILKKNGLEGLKHFRDNRTLYNSPDRYLYIYDITGVNIFHAGMPDLEGKNLWDLTDKSGKKPIQMIVAALDDANNPHAWVHYSWWEPGKFYPVPKSSCHFKVTTKEGKVLFIGGGLNFPHEEKEFIRIIVDDAAELIEKKGHSALSVIADPLAFYSFRDVKVFAFTSTGELLISPVMNDSLADFKLLDCVDEMGHKPFAKALLDLKSKQTVWEVFLAKNRYQRNLVKKSLYLRKVNNGEQEIYVGAITDLPQPPG
jgi:hypothetical protein